MPISMWTPTPDTRGVACGLIWGLPLLPLDTPSNIK